MAHGLERRLVLRRVLRGDARPEPAQPAVTAEIDRIADLWLDDVGVDGFGIDAARRLIEDDADYPVNS
jgi:glycosidase